MTIIQIANIKSTNAINTIYVLIIIIIIIDINMNLIIIIINNYY